MKTTQYLSLIILTFIAFNASAQNSDIGGTWILKDKQHITGPEYANALPTQMKVEQRKDSILLESTSIGGNGQNVVWKQTFATNGKPSTITDKQSNRKYVRSLQWSADKKTLVLTTVIYVPGDDKTIDLTRTESWTLEGNKLTIDKKSAETTHESWEVKGVFEKQ